MAKSQLDKLKTGLAGESLVKDSPFGLMVEFLSSCHKIKYSPAKSLPPVDFDA